MNNLVRLIQGDYNGDSHDARLHVRVAVLEDRMQDILQTLATKAELKAVEGDLRKEINNAEERLVSKIEVVKNEVQAVKIEIETVRTEIETVRTEIETVRTEIETVRTEIQKEQKSTRSLLLTIGGGMIATIIATSVFGGKGSTPQVVYLPPQSAAPSVNTISELHELQERLLKIEQGQTEVQSNTNGTLPPSN